MPLDQLALALLKILRDGIIYEIKHATTTYCKLLSLCENRCLGAYILHQHLPNHDQINFFCRRRPMFRPLYIPTYCYYLCLAVTKTTVASPANDGFFCVL